MRKTHALVFDDFISPPSLSQFTFSTSPLFAGYLATDDQIALQLIVDRVTFAAGTSPSISATVQTSPNLLDWAGKSSSTAAEINVTSGMRLTSATGWDTGAAPTMKYGRILITFAGLTALPASAHVRVYVTMRDAAQIVYTPALAAKQIHDVPNKVLGS